MDVRGAGDAGAAVTPVVPDLLIPAGPGVPDGLTIPEADLVERFSRSSGPGGQSVNTTDSRVSLSWDVASSEVLSSAQRHRLRAALGPRLRNGVLTVVSSTERSQLQNRADARSRLASLVGEALRPPPPARRATRPSRAARQRRLDSKKHRSDVKVTRRRPPPD